MLFISMESLIIFCSNSQSYVLFITFIVIFLRVLMRRVLQIFIVLVMSVASVSPLFSQSKKALKFHEKAAKDLSDWQSPFPEWNHVGEIKIDSIALNQETSSMVITFGKTLSYLPIRESTYQKMLQSIRKPLRRKFSDYTIKIVTDGQALETLVPNYYRKSMKVDLQRLAPDGPRRIPLVRRLDKDVPSKGLYNRNIALWHSHGWYYESKLDRWEWQRTRTFNTVEDIFPMTFVLPYLVPMLENAGANVFLPRERDTQTHEVIVDNNGSTQGSQIKIPGGLLYEIEAKGFARRDTLFAGENPFQMGNHLKFPSSKDPNQFLKYVPNIPEDGEYAVYVSYHQSEDNISDVKYSIFHEGGQTDFLVNQQIGGGTWVYLGTFPFRKGINPDMAAVWLSTQSEQSGWITADAVRFGGGMGNVARKPQAEPKNKDISWKISQRPRYMEATRYYMQYAGMPDSLVYLLNDNSDYKDDYQSRGEWVNYLMGAPNGPNIDRSAKGLKIPIDLSLAFHTDAGITPKDSTIGTLAIYSAVSDGGKFPNGKSRVASRDLSDMIQTEVVHDIRTQFDPAWSRRGLWNKEYSEAFRPNTPAMLLELLSHQNLTDMQFGHDPRFKFAASRAIYKGMVKFLTFQRGVDYVIQPLPVDHFSITKLDGKKVRLSWEPVLDSLETSAVPTAYKVYQRTGDLGFDNGTKIHGNSMELELENYGEIYSFKITAMNEGGESFASEILSVGLMENDTSPVLVVNAFDRVAAPTVFDEGNFAGMAHWDDEGVADKYNIGYTGTQYDFDRQSPWLDDDSPGWGASHGNMEGKLIPGNSFDNTYIHGKSILAARHSFISTSDGSFGDPEFDTTPYPIVDLILGEEKTTISLGKKYFQVFDKRMQQKITDFTRAGGNIFASGAYIGSDFILSEDSVARAFANDILHFQWRTNHAVKSGEVHATDEGLFDGSWNFNTIFDPKIYKVEAPDAIEPHGKNALSAFRYSENNTSAGTTFQGNYKTVILGFPFETILDDKGRNQMMGQILNFFDN